MTKGESAWEIFDEDARFAGMKYGPQRVRMVVVGLGPGELLVVSPGMPQGDGFRALLSRWGTPTFLLAPNHFHNSGLAFWKKEFPDAKVVAHARAQKRLRRKVSDVPIDDLSLLEAALPEGVRIFSPPMAKQGETFVSVRTREGRAWFVTDAMVNETKLPGGPLGLFMKILGFREKLMTNPFFKRLFLKDLAGYKAWISAEIANEEPCLFVPSHGAPLRGPDVTQQLREAATA
ncbi:MAG: hypothetical protein HOV80_09660 [Polyangiaceae bacterium]|nr:hypothetical protein [Polyangiaceae bacterium]